MRLMQTYLGKFFKSTYVLLYLFLVFIESCNVNFQASTSRYDTWCLMINFVCITRVRITLSIWMVCICNISFTVLCDIGSYKKLHWWMNRIIQFVWEVARFVIHYNISPFTFSSRLCYSNSFCQFKSK